ncbi:Cell division coordinator CpoB [Methylobacterium organophilum]|uniref:Cell division coordinator CpoB n=2 Tax=Methylobacterium organophilum TaxID=410 RepID=A0ABQ4TAZ7_METOR|nr:Cell division coordinator CpoB [Methylobacterium organophilum]
MPMLRRLLLTTCLGWASLSPASAQDAADLIVRLNRLENVSRQLSGQIEQLQYENRSLKEQLRKFQEDVEFRFQESKGGGSARKGPAPAASPSGGAPYGTNPGEGRPGKRGDAFDPGQNPGAPGAPRQLGTTTPSAPLETTPVARAEPLPQGALPDPDAEHEEGDLPPPGLGGPVDLSPPPARVPTTGAISPPPPKASIAATGSGDAEADFEAASTLVRERQYEQAEMSLRQFIQSHPRDKLVARATYWLGESYLQRNRNREAAEQFLKVSTDYANSPVAPEAMMKLGASLAALGAKAQACATLAEVERKFPSAGAGVRQGVEREQKRARCTT